jgi:nitrogen fixation/metabolism regulation signal transduction histidine kinase
MGPAAASKQTEAEDDSTYLESIYGSFEVDRFTLPVISKGSIHEAAIFILHPNTEFQQLQDSLNKRIFLIIGAGVLITVLFSIVQARDVTKPLHQLAIAAGSLSLQKLDVDFDATGRNDEVGVLNDALQKMVRQLRQNRVELAGAEQRAAFAEIARQVNHDIKNGFIPIRNVVRHWTEIAETKPEQLPNIFNERKATVMESLDYLESLANRYSRIEPKIFPAAVGVNKVISKLLKNYQELRYREILFRAELDPSDPNVYVDAVQFRRAFENILHNAIEAIVAHGAILVSTETTDSQVFVSCHDNGVGIPEEIRRQLFATPITTKPDGTGLGLLSVKHIIEGFGGSVAIESEIGLGTTVRLILPRLFAERGKRG